MLVSMQIKAYILRRLTRKKSINFEIQKAINILFLRYDRIGDMVITTPVFRELKLAYPEINITVLASKANQYVLINNPYVDRVITNHKNNLLKDLPTLLALRKEKFDVCVEFDHSVVPHSIVRLRIIKPKKIISIKKDGRYGVNGNELSLYDVYTEKQTKEHFRDIWLGVLEPFGINPKSRDYDLFVTDEQNKKAQNYVKQFPSKFLVGINLEGAVKGKKIESSELFQICQGLHDQNKNIQTALAVNISSPTLSGVGNEPEVIGNSFGLEVGQTSKAILGNSGVFYVYLEKLNKAEDLPNYFSFANSLSSSKTNNLNTKVYEALKDASNIDDKRSLFY